MVVLRSKHDYATMHVMTTKTIDLDNRYQIIESDLGPLISESRSTVYDVLELDNKGRNDIEISIVLNLTPLQVKTALRYIEQHRERLQPELDEILRIAAERKKHYDAIYAEIRKKIDAQPMTPERAKFKEIVARNRARREADAKNLE